MKKGATLVETVLYLVILALFAVVIIEMFLVMMRSFAVFRTGRAVSQSATVSLERMVREIRQASSIDLANSTFITNPGRLTLNTTDSQGQSTTIEFSVNGNTLIIREADGPAAPSTGPEVRVNNLVFYQENTPRSKAVKVEMTLLHPGGGRTPARSDKFYDTAVLRGSY